MSSRTSPDFGVRAEGMRDQRGDQGVERRGIRAAAGRCRRQRQRPRHSGRSPVAELLETIHAGTRSLLKVKRDAAVVELAGTFAPKSIGKPRRCSAR